ncbi:uncharacterized protein isoform X2 [Rhodnius prolixus]|uniref:uncharacterized protein isoform X2 n=1 Tax=Rhodnius prolixus TaxID=13249 RepID=UPI003D18814F
MDDILSSPSDIDPTTFLQVEMNPHQDVSLDPDIVLSASPNAEQLQEVPGIFAPCDVLPGAEITPITLKGNKANDQIVESDSTNFNFCLLNEETPNQHSISGGSSTTINMDERKHKCDICHYKFKRLDHLKRHMKIHPIDEVLVAQVRQQCAREEAAAKKKAALEDELRRYTCNVCHYKFKRADHLKRHMTRSHPEELALIAATEELAKARQAAKAAKMMGRFEDSQDNQEEEYATERMKEINPDDERKFPCTLCDFKFKRRDHLNRHMTVHTDQIIMPRVAERSGEIIGDRTEEENLWLSSMRRFSCTLCDAKFKRADHLKRHMLKHSSSAMSSFNGHFDGESSTTQSMMELDNSSELVVMDEGSNSNVGIDDTDPSPRGDDDDRRFVCNVCTFRFKRRFHLMRHMIKHTEDKFVNLGLAREGENDKKTESVQDSEEQNSPELKQALGQVIFKCTVCELQFKQPYRLKVHMARHSEERLFACPLCNYRAKLACNLRKHMLTHTNEKPFACHLCNYRGKLACALKDHIMLIHSDDKPYSCDVCEFKAKVPSHLKKHMVSHQDETPYQCNVCDFRAKRAGNLKEHMGTHTSEKRYLRSN